MKLNQLKYIVLLASFSLAGCSDSEDVVLVKTGSLKKCGGKTVEEAVDGLFSSPKWESGESEDGERFVNVIGEISFKDKPVEAALQFVIDEDGEGFSYNALEFNGVPQVNLIALGLMSKLCE